MFAPCLSMEPWQSTLLSGVTRLQWARMQVFQKGLLFPKKTFKKQRRANFGPPQRWARVHCTPYCYATDPTDPLESVPMVWLSISGQYSLQVIHASTKLC